VRLCNALPLQSWHIHAVSQAIARLVTLRGIGRGLTSPSSSSTKTHVTPWQVELLVCVTDGTNTLPGCQRSEDAHSHSAHGIETHAVLQVKDNLEGRSVPNVVHAAHADNGLICLAAFQTAEKAHEPRRKPWSSCYIKLTFAPCMKIYSGCHRSRTGTGVCMLDTTAGSSARSGTRTLEQLPEDKSTGSRVQRR
jgi:hypothetical protein